MKLRALANGNIIEAHGLEAAALIQAGIFVPVEEEPPPAAEPKGVQAKDSTAQAKPPRRRHRRKDLRAEE